MKVGELLVTLGLDTNDFDKGVKQAQRKVSALGNVLSNALSFTLGMGLFDAIKAGFDATVKSSLDFNAMMEQAQIGFTTMLGSAEKAQAFLDEMADFAAKTPFEYPELLEAARRMMAMGFAAGEVLPTLKAVGDAAAGLGVGKDGIDRLTLALGQMRAKGKVSAEEMMQLTEAGVPAWDILAKAIGKSTAETMKLAEKGLIPADKAVSALIEGMEKRFPNMMQRMEDGWLGILSTIKDVWRMTIGAMTSGLFKSMTSWLQGVRDWATEFYNTFRQFGLSAALTKAFGADFAAAITIASAVLRGFWNTARTVAGAIARNWAIIKPFVLGAVTAFLSFRIVSWVLTLAQKAVAGFTFATAVMRGEAVAASGILNFVARAVQIYRLQLHLASMAGIQHIGILQTLRTVLYSVWSALGPVGWAILGVSAAVTVGISLWSKYAASVEKANLTNALKTVSGQNTNVADSSHQAAAGLKDQADATKEAGKAASKNIQSFDEVHQLMEDTASAAEQAAAGMGEAAMPSLEIPGGSSAAALPGMDMSTLEQMKPTWSGFWQWIVNELKGKWEGIKGYLVSAWDWIVSKTEPVWSPVANFFSLLWNSVKTITAGVWDEISSFLSTTWDNMHLAASTIFGTVKDFISGTWDNIYSTASTVWNAIWSFLSGLWNSIYTLASTIWQTIKDLITGKIDLRTAAATIWGAIKQFFSDTWNNIKQTTVIIWGALRDFFTTEWNLIKQTAETIWGAIKKFLSDTWNEIKITTENIWQLVTQSLSEVWSRIKDTATTIWDEIKGAITTPMESAKTSLENIWEGIRSFVINKWNAIKSGISSTGSSLLGAITKPFVDAKATISDLIEDAYNWGKNLIQNVIDGIKSKIKDVKDAISNVANTVKNYIGFSSPTEEGPGRYADQWAPNLMRMYADGILSNAGLIKTAVNTVAESLSGMTAAPVFAGGIAGGRSGFAPVAAPEIHLHIGTLIADDYGLKQLEQKLRNIRIYEDQRLGSDAK